MRIYIREPELSPRTPPQDELRPEVAQAVAVVSLLLERWYEPPAPGALHLSTLVQQLLSLIGWPDAAGTSQKVVAFETALAEASWTRVQQRDPDTQYNPASKAELQALAPQFPWGPYLEGASIADRDRFIVTTNTAFPKLAAVVASAPRRCETSAPTWACAARA